MADPVEAQNQPAGAQAGQPAPGSKSDAAPNEQQDKDDERLSLRQRAIEAERKVQRLEAEKKAAQEEKLKESGKWQEVATQKEAEAKSLRDALRRERVERTIASAGVKAGAVDPEDLVRFVQLPDDLDDSDRDALGAAISAEIEKLSKSKPYLFATNKTKNGTPFQTPAATPGGPVAKVPDGIKAQDVHSLSREQKQALVKQTFGDKASGGGFFRKG